MDVNERVLVRRRARTQKKNWAGLHRADSDFLGVDGAPGGSHGLGEGDEAGRLARDRVLLVFLPCPNRGSRVNDFCLPVLKGPPGLS